MRKIEAIIRKSKFKEVKLNLIEEGFSSFSYLLTRCISKASEKRFYRGVEYDSKASERVSLSLYVNYKDLSRALSIITDSGSTGDASDCFVNVLEVSESYQIQGGEKDTLKNIQ